LADRKRRVYWDSCVWLSLIKGDAERAEHCAHVIEMARAGEFEVWTSSLTLAEVYKRKCDGDNVTLEEDKDANFESYIEQEFLREVQVDHDVGSLARRLLRKYPAIKKPADAVHLASALLNNCDEFHTYDGENLLGLDGKLQKLDGSLLKICHPPKPTNQQIKIELDGGRAGPAAAPAGDEAGS
jgi:predicted nucleic acid-binding protein